jgi:hypothetical protein
MYVQWQRTSIVETLRADKATRHAGDNVAKCQYDRLLFVTLTANRARDTMAEETFQFYGEIL